MSLLVMYYVLFGVFLSPRLIIVHSLQANSVETQKKKATESLSEAFEAILDKSLFWRPFIWSHKAVALKSQRSGLKRTKCPQQEYNRPVKLRRSCSHLSSPNPQAHTLHSPCQSSYQTVSFVLTKTGARHRYKKL